MFKVLIDRDMKKKDLKELASISPTTMAKLSKNELVSMEVLIRICMVLNVTFDEIMDIDLTCSEAKTYVNKKGSIDDMNYSLVKQIRDDDILRKSFIDLAIRTFDLSFENWYKNGYWTDKYIRYVLVDNDKVISNASVNIIDTVWEGTPKRYIQIGTVMTDPSYRKSGLSTRLINEIITDWKDKADAIYLFANPTSIGFYPKFGFEKADEYQYSVSVTPTSGDFRKLDMENESDISLLRQYYERSNPFSQLPMNNNYGLLMFYCSSFMKNCVYYSEKNNAVVVAMQNETTLLCFDIFCDDNISMSTIINELSSDNTNQSILGFTPKQTSNCSCEKIEGEDTLYIYSRKENVFKDNRVMFPSLSHA